MPLLNEIFIKSKKISYLYIKQINKRNIILLLGNKIL